MTEKQKQCIITIVMIKNKKITTEKIKQAAIEEFLDKGYAGASLRRICSRAGVTTGAMYFCFDNKEALFRAILEPLIFQYEKLLAEYMQIELEQPERAEELDVRMMEFILAHRKETVIVMEKAQGSCYENFRNKVEALMEQSFRIYFESRLNGKADDNLIKILAKIRLDGCLEIIKGNYEMEYSLELTERIGIYANGGAEKLIEKLKESHGF